MRRILPKKIPEQDHGWRWRRSILVQLEHQEAVQCFFRDKSGVSWRATTKDRIHVGIIDDVLGGLHALLGSTFVTQWTLIDIVLIEVSEERLDACGNPSALVGNTPASVADPDVPVILVALMVGAKIRFANPFGVGMEDTDDNVFGRFKGFGIPTDNMQEEFPA